MNSVSKEHVCLGHALHGITLLKDSVDADRCGLLCLLIKLALHSGRTVSLVTSEFPAVHYKGILKKLGVNVDRNAAALSTIDLLASLDAWEPDQAVLRLEELAQDLQTTSSDRHIVIIDSLSYISNVLDERCSSIVNFTQSLTSMAMSSKSAVSLLMVAHEDIPEQEKWLTFLEHMVDTVITLEALPVGQAADVQMRVLLFRPNCWGRAMDPDTPPETAVQLHEEMYASVSERSISLRQAAQ